MNKRQILEILNKAKMTPAKIADSPDIDTQDITIENNGKALPLRIRQIANTILHKMMRQGLVERESIKENYSRGRSTYLYSITDRGRERLKYYKKKKLYT